MKRIIYSMFLLMFLIKYMYWCEIFLSTLVTTFIFRRMINTGHEGRRTTWRRSAHGTPGAWRRTRSPSVPPSWSGRTPRCDRKWPSCGKTSAAARRSCRCTRPNMARCEGHTSPRTHISLPYNSHSYSAGPCGRWTRVTRAIVFLRRSKVKGHNIKYHSMTFDPSYLILPLSTTPNVAHAASLELIQCEEEMKMATWAERRSRKTFPHIKSWRKTRVRERLVTVTVILWLFSASF